MKRALLLMFALAAGCKPPAPPQPIGGAGGGGKRAFPVEVRKVTTEDVHYTIHAVGSLEPEEQVRVTARVAGMVEKVMFEEGAKVTTRTVLAEIDRSRYQMLADRAKASQERAAADVRKAEIVLQNRQELKKKDPGYVSDEEIATLSSQLSSVRAASAEAKSSLDLALHDLENSQVRSLITGVIDTKAVSTGQYVAPGAQLASIVDESKLKLRFKVSETESVKLNAVLSGDRRVSFTVRPLPGKTFTAELIHMSPQANVQTRTVECLAMVENRDELLKPGFFATVRAVVATHEKAVVVPDSAILPTERGFVAFVVKDSRANQRAVRPGLFVREGVVEILEGLTAGEVLVVTGTAAISDGTELIVKEAPPPSPPTRTVRD
ncbi:MAG: efflux RND transporter periplasmic adaptor subunit [Planctomycetes bacterium]|nr:efflux RND transporter periplasmic adaptor subunit [Planctomycetota bacterium]